MNFSMRLKDLRQSKHLTQRELAKELKIGYSTLAMYETGKREPDHAMLQFIADYFNVSVDYLLGHDIPDLVSISIAKAEKMPKNEDEKAALADLKAMPIDEQQRLIFEEYNNLTPEQRKAIDLIIRSLASSRQ